MYVPKLRKVNDVLKEIKKVDPNTAITENVLRTMIKDGTISHLKLGPTVLINPDELYSLFW